MIYTVGNKKSYTRAIRHNRQLEPDNPSVMVKVGKEENYAGGYAFSTLQDAQQFIDQSQAANWAVFTLRADWNDTTVYFNSEVGLTLLLIDCTIQGYFEDNGTYVDFYDEKISE